MFLDLAQRDYKKHTWISQLSLLFAFHNGYLIHDNGHEIEIALDNVYDSKAKFVVRNHYFEDVDVLYSLLITNKYDFLMEIIESIPGLRIKKVISMGAGIGIAAICLVKFLGDISIQVYESNNIEFVQLQKNLILNENESKIISIYSQYEYDSCSMENVDLLIFSAEEIKRFLLNSEVMHKITIAKIIVIKSFISNDDQKKFIKHISTHNFNHKHVEQNMVCWKL